MCTPTLIGIGIGATIGGIKGGPKGALIGGVAGGLGGYALGPSGAGLFGTAGTGPLGGTLTSTLVTGTGGQTFIQPATSIFAGGGGGGGLLGGIFSPQFSLATQLVGFGVQAIGAQQTAAFQRAQIAFRQSVLRNQQIAAAQDNKALLERLEVQKGIIGGQGKQARGQLRVDAAGRGVLVDVGSEADKTEQLAAQVAFQKLLFEQETDLKIRDNNIRAAGFQTDSALLNFQLADSQRAGAFGLVGGALKQASTLSSQFTFNRGGQLAFRTRSA
jgi:hypothetical protein